MWKRCRKYYNNSVWPAVEICLCESVPERSDCSGTDIDGFVNLYNKAEAILKGNTDKYQDAYGMYRVNGKTYRALRSCDATGYHYVTEGDEITEITVSD